MAPNRWLILLVLFTARTTMAFQFQSVASVSPMLVPELHIDLAALGVLVGAWMLPGVFVAIPGGLLGQRFGDKRVVIAGLGLMVAGSVLVATADGYGAALVGRVVSGTGAVLLNVLLTKMVTDWFSGPQVATAMGIFVVSWPLGIGLSLLLLGPIAAASSWRFAIQVTAAACVVALVLVALLYRSKHPTSAPTEALPSAWRLSRRELTLTCVAGLVWALFNVAYIIVVSFSPLLLSARGLAPGSAAVVASFATWPLVATIPLGGLLADRTGRGRTIMFASFIALAMVMPLLTVAPSPILVLAIIGLLGGLPAGIIMTLPARALSPSSRHLGMGLFYALYYLAMAVLPAAAGALRGVLAFDAAPLLLASFLLLAATACLLLFDRLARSMQGAAAGPSAQVTPT
ncbi:MAG TPA: MFS transporter [Caldimonas sp.]|jgi:MFS family permease